MLNLNELSREIRDKILMKEDMEPTFGNVLSENYTDELFKTLEERRNKKSQHSYIATWHGVQGSGKCIDSDELVYFKRKGIGWIVDTLSNINVGDVVWSSGYNGIPSFSRVLNVWKRKQRGFIIKTKRSSEFIVSKDHKHIIKRNEKIIEVSTNHLRKGDIFLNYRFFVTDGLDINCKSYSMGFVAGVYLADGCINFETNNRPFLIITKCDGVVKNKIQYHFKKVFGEQLNEYKTKGKIALTLSSCSSLMIKYFESFGQRNNKFFVPFQFNISFLKGLLDGYVNCDSGINVNKYKKKRKIDIKLTTNSKRLCYALHTTVAKFGFCASYKKRILKSGKWKGNEYHILTFGRREGQRFLNFINLLGHKKSILNEIKSIPSIITNSDVIKVSYNLFENPLKDVIDTKKIYDMVDIETEKGNFYLSNNILTHNSYSALALAGVLDSDFNSDKIYFDVEELVNDRHKLKAHDAVVCDELARAFGLDSNRITIMIQTIKEQLRKKSIHMFYNSPVLKSDEHRSSMYVFETLFIDKINKLSFHAYKTNELLCLGYVVIPHPLHFISKKTLLDYERKKDEHLKEVLEGPKDMVEERSELIIKNDYFVKAEKLYKQARGYIPYKILVQIVEKIFPEFKGSVIVYELADRIKANKEISGSWCILGNMGKE